MRLSIGSLSKLSGVSVRALHHYDQIGLLPPSEVTPAGYRYYDDAAIERLWQILFYREVDFPLHDIAEILSSPGFDRTQALARHQTLLVQKRNRLNRLIELVSNTINSSEKGATTMEFKPFDTAEIDALREQYAEEAKSRWGNTSAYRQSMDRASKQTDQDRARMQRQSGEIFSNFAALVGSDPAGERVQSLVARWQTFISENHYDCTDEILASLGRMYVADERFAQNIDRYGAGTAQLMSDAIAVYCSNKA